MRYFVLCLASIVSALKPDQVLKAPEDAHLSFGIGSATVDYLKSWYMPLIFESI